jgi:endonuclease/exonuclease/phosphatase family metal-dependent hydrolase
MFYIVANTTSALGNALLVSKSSPAQVLPDSTLCFCPPGNAAVCALSCLLNFDGMVLAVFGIYRSPRALAQPTAELFHHIVVTATLYNTPHIVVMGDFNIDTTNVHDPHLASLHLQLLQPLHLHQTTNDPTTDNNTCIDHIFTSLPMDQRHGGTLNSYISDHYPCFMSFERQPPRGL